MDANRREFLRAGLIVAGALGLGAGLVLNGCGVPEDGAGGASSDCLPVEIAVTPAVIAMGRAYLERVPAEADRALLAEELFGGSGSAGVERCTARLRERIGRDLAGRETLEIEGFSVARSELRLYAFLSLGAAE